MEMASRYVLDTGWGRATLTLHQFTRRKRWPQLLMQELVGSALFCLRPMKGKEDSDDSGDEKGRTVWKIIFVSPSVEEMVGQKPETLEGDDFLKMVHREGLSLDLEVTLKSLSSRSSGPISAHRFPDLTHDSISRIPSLGNLDPRLICYSYFSPHALLLQLLIVSIADDVCSNVMFLSTTIAERGCKSKGQTIDDDSLVGDQSSCHRCRRRGHHREWIWNG